MYRPYEILRGLRHPRRIFRELNKLLHTRGGRYELNPNGTGIFEEDWDHLVILDACRYDAFCEVSDLPGETDFRYSLAPATYEFIPANFSNRIMYDTVYVGANTWYQRLKDEINSDVYKFVNLRDEQLDIEWANEELNIPTANAVTTQALDLKREHPKKRLIIHYLQPHHPFIGPKGKKYSNEQSTSLIEVVNSSNKSDEFLWEAYYENLEIVLREMDALFTELDGRIAITADHGEMLGDRHRYIPIRDYGHHPGIFNDPTVKVPWHVYESGERPQFEENEPIGDSDVAEEKVARQLKDLGYKL